MSDKTALVVAGATGMGAAVARALTSDGFRVVATYDPSEETEALALSQADEAIETVPADLADRSSVAALIELLSVRSFDAIVNAAGFFEFERFDDFDLDIWDKTFEVNVRAPLAIFHGLKGSLAPGAAIVNMTTTDAFVGAYASSAWAASKSALISLTKSLANNLGGRGHRVNAVAVGWVGDLADMGDSDVQRGSVEITPLGRLGSQDEVAKVILFLTSPASSFVSGATLVVDGGYTGVDIIGKREAETL